MRIEPIPELKVANDNYRKKRNDARKALAKIRKLEQKFYFLKRIVEPRKNTDTKTEDVELEYAVMDLFKSLNFKCKKPVSESDVDAKVKFKKLYLGLEVKNGNLVGENETFQPLKHKILNDDDFHPIVVFNNAKHNDNWGNARIKIAGIGFEYVFGTRNMDL